MVRAAGDSGFIAWADSVDADGVADAAALAAHLADTVDAHDASAVSFVPAQGLAATTVQAAIEEVVTDAAATYEARTLPTSRSAGTVLGGSFDPATSIFNGTSTNTLKARAALARTKSSTYFARVACWGDSRVKGLSAAGITYDQSWPYRLKNRLKSLGYPCAGDGFVIAGLHDSATITDGRWTFAGTWDHVATSSGYKWGARAGSVGATATFVTSEPCTTVEVHYFNNIGNAVTVTIDGAAQTGITPAGGNTLGSRAYSGLSNTTHTVVITTSGTSFVLHAIDCYSASGFVVDNLGYSGSSTSDWTGSAWNDLKAMALRAQTGTANVTLLGIGTNDMTRDPVGNNGVTAANFPANLATIIDAAQAGSDVALVASPPVSTTYAGAGIEPYFSGYYAQAIAQGVPLLDLTDRFVNYSLFTSTGMVSSDTVHESASGYDEESRYILSLLGLDGTGVDGGWLLATLGNSWTNIGSPYASAGYRKDSAGVVHLRGAVTGGAYPSVPFTLPVGYRPQYTTILPAVSNSAFGNIVISTDGTVQANSGSGWLSLEGITFLV